MSGARLIAALAVMASGTLAVPASAPAAGLFDAVTTIFGADPPPLSPRYYGHARPYGLSEETEPLDVTVRGRRGGRKPVRAEVPGPKPVNTAIDPVRHPDWFLHDPTLRRGDIVVLPNRVLVVDGGLSDGRMTLVPIDQSRTMSRAERLKVRAMAGLPPEPRPGESGAGRSKGKAVAQVTP